jgi:RHS repeat-associated protein
MSGYLIKISTVVIFLIFFLPSLLFADLQTYDDEYDDAAGTPVAMSDASGEVVWRADYMPFGEEHEITGNVKNKNRFIGKEKDEETDLYYFGARYLEARTGRFIKPDPVGIREADLLNPQRLNRYSYSLNNPYRYVDPDGNIPIPLIIGAMWAITEFGLSAYDAYDTAGTVLSPKTSLKEKGVAAGLFAVGMVAPGGGYSKLDDILRTVKATRPLNKMGHAMKHLQEFQKIDPKLKAEDVAKILEHVKNTGAVKATKHGGKLYEGTVEIGKKKVKLKVVESSGGTIKTGFPETK